MSVVKDKNYFSVFGWMINRLQLKGNELIIYAIIYGFSQTENQRYTGSRRYLAEFAGCSVRTVDCCLSKLVDMGLILKQEHIKNNVKFCEYIVNHEAAENFAPRAEIAPPPRADSAHNNKEYNTKKYYNKAVPPFIPLEGDRTDKKRASALGRVASDNIPSENLRPIQIADKLYSLYPKKTAMIAAKRAAMNTVRELFDKGMSYDDIESKLLKDVKEYADIVSKWSEERKRYIYNMVKFFSDGHYDDDREYWKQLGVNYDENGTPEISATDQIAMIQGGYY